jgi:uncharacterized protein YjbI with pentapeptide repeats
VNDVGGKLSRYVGAISSNSAILAIVLVGVCLTVATITEFAQAQSIHKGQPLLAQTPDTGQTAPGESNLEEEKLKLETAKLRQEVENNERSLTSIAGWRNLLFVNVSALVAIVLGFIGLGRYLRERKEELLKREDERFEEVVRGMGSDIEQQRVSSAVLLPTYLRPGAERFYVQVFNLAAGNLRPSTPTAAADSEEQSRSEPSESRPLLNQILANVLGEWYFRLLERPSTLTAAADSEEPSRSEPSESGPSPLNQILANVLRESFSRARDSLRAENERQAIDRVLNAAGVNLDRAFLEYADLKRGSWRQASFREARLTGATLTGAILEGANLSHAELNEADLSGANLREADFTNATLEYAVLSGSHADDAVFRDANMSNVIMEGGTLRGADLANAHLTKAQFSGVNFAPIPPSKKRANPEAAMTLSEAEFDKVQGLTEEQIALCQRKGARFDTRQSS